MRPGPILNGRAVTVTEINCPLCTDQRHRTVGRTVPKLRKVEGDPQPFCVALHGYVSAAELDREDLTARVEITPDDHDGASYIAICPGHTTGRGLDQDNLVHDTHEMWNLEDVIEVVSIHVDSCKRCGDPNCANLDRHDRGHRCRKDS